MGKGLLRLYLALWLVWFSYGVIDNYKELATYYGYDKWTIEKAAEREQLRWKKECEGKPVSLECPPPGLVPSDDFASEERVNVVVWMFNMAMIKAPFFFLLFLTAMYWLGKWVIAGFRKKNTKT
jgi:hypothetical protein